MGDNDAVSETTRLNADGDKTIDGKESAATADGKVDDDPKVTFVNGKKDVKVDIDGKHSVEDEFRGLTKEELMKYANDPFWVRVRYVLLILFWVIWFGMLVAAILIIVFTPKCPPRPKLTWWQSSVAYDAVPRSFFDTNGDGVGDIKGLHEQLNYIMDDVNASVVVIGPIYESPQVDFGYDVSDYKKIDSIFGTLDDFKDLRVTMHKKNARLIMDFIPNHTSKNHTWFVESSKNNAPDNKYANYYIWRDPPLTDPNSPPNNWKSVYGGSAWTYDSTRMQFYLHHFLPDQPDLNLTNKDVLNELDEAMTFWLEQGVDGFRLSGAAYLAEDKEFKDEPANGEWTNEPNDYNSLLHNYTTFQAETYDLVNHWKDLVKKYADEEGRQHPRVLLVDADGSDEQIQKFYDTVDGLVMPLNKKLVKMDKNCHAKCIEKLVQEGNNRAGETNWNSWMLGDMSKSRVISRLGDGWSVASLMLLMTLPGTPFVYYGDEIGMRDVNLTRDQTKDPVGLKFQGDNYARYSRDPQRTPLQWNNQDNAGFTSGTPWLPVGPDYKERNVATQKARGSNLPELEVMTQMASLHNEPSFLWGTYHDSSSGKLPESDDMLSYVRQAERFPGFLVLINFGDKAATETFYKASGGEDQLVTPRAILRAHTHNFESHFRTKDFEIGSEVNLGEAIYLDPKEGVVLELIHETE